MRRRIFIAAAASALVVALGLPSARAASSAAVLRLVPDFGPPTSSVKAAGRGFQAGETVDLTFDQAPIDSAQANGKGKFKTAVIVPGSALPGDHVITAAGESSGEVASAPFTVRTDWTRFHFDAANTGLNPYENVLSPANVGFLAPKWIFPTAGYVDSSPAVVDGVVYIGAGSTSPGADDLYALDAATGSLLWNYHNLQGQDVTGDPTAYKGIVYMGTLLDHSLHAYDAKTGTPLWTYAGAIGTPNIVEGVLYDVDNTGVVTALDPISGRRIWRYSLPTTVSSFAMASSRGLLYVGGDDHKIYAIDLASRTVVWVRSTGDDIISSPGVFNGVVYVGSIDHNLYAFRATDGMLLWKAATGGNVESSPAVADGIVYVGSTDHNVYAFDAGTGITKWVAPTANAIVLASPVVANGVVYVGSLDQKIYALDAQTGAELWAWATEGVIGSTPAVSDGVLYVGSFDKNIYAFDLGG